MNQIHKKRAEIEKFFDATLILPDEHITDQSASGNYQLDVDVYAVNDPTRNWRIAAATITDLRTKEIIAQIKRNDDSFFYAWLDCDGTEYLLCAEDLEGQTVLDLTHRQMASYCSDDDTFIWMQFYPSPGKSRIAIDGCYWASPTFISVYDFKDPLQLPLKRMLEISLAEGQRFEKWMRDDTFCIQDKNGDIQTCQVG